MTNGADFDVVTGAAEVDPYEELARALGDLGLARTRIVIDTHGKQRGGHAQVESLLPGARFLLFPTGPSVRHKAPQEAMGYALRTAHDRGIPIALFVNSAMDIHQVPEEVRSSVRVVILHPNAGAFNYVHFQGKSVLPLGGGPPGIRETAERIRELMA